MKKFSSSTYPLSLLIQRISSRLCAGIDFCKNDLIKTFCEINLPPKFHSPQKSTAFRSQPLSNVNCCHPFCGPRLVPGNRNMFGETPQTRFKCLSVGGRLGLVCGCDPLLPSQGAASTSAIRIGNGCHICSDTTGNDQQKNSTVFTAIVVKMAPPARPKDSSRFLEPRREPACRGTSPMRKSPPLLRPP